MEFDFSRQPGRKLNTKYIPDNHNYKISLVTIYNNSCGYFVQTFNSICNQTFPYFEWIIVDFESANKEDIEKLDHLTSEDPRIKIYRTKSKGSSLSLWDFAVQKTNTDIFIPVNAGDLLDPLYIEYIYWGLETNPEASWAYTDVVNFGEEEFLAKVDIFKLNKMNKIWGTAAIRKKDYLEIEGNLSDCEYGVMQLKLIEKGKIPVHINQYLFWKRAIQTQKPSSSKTADKNNESTRLIPEVIKEITFSGIQGREFPKPCISRYSELVIKKDKTRILLLLPHMERGGADKFNLDIITNIDKNKYEIGIITTVPAESEWRQLFKDQVDDIFELPSFLRIEDWCPFVHYYISSRNVDIVLNIASYFGYYLFPWLRKEFPTIGLMDVVHAESKYWRAGGYPRISSATNDILEKTYTTNEYTRKIILENYGGNREKIETIYTGVDEKYFDPSKAYEDIRQKLGINKDRPVILFLCRLTVEKRPFLMVEIANKVKATRPDICFLVVGDGALYHELEKAIQARRLNNNVYLVGIQEDIRPFYAQSDLFLICSIKEGLAITTFEAMLMKVPVISSDVGGQSELVSNKTGRLIPCLQHEEKDFYSRDYSDDEVNLYVKAIEELLKDKHGLVEMGDNCRDKILNGYTLKQMMTKLHTQFELNNSPDNEKNRIITSKLLRQLPNMVDEYAALYSTYSKLEQEYNSLWTIYNDQLGMGGRAFALVRKYHNFVTNNAVGRFMHKLLKFITASSRNRKKGN